QRTVFAPGPEAGAAPGPAGRRVDGVDRARAAREPGSTDRVDPATAGRPRRAAVLPAVHDRAARAGLVGPGLPGPLAVPALRALERRLAGRAADLPLPGRAPLGAAGAVGLLDLELPGLRAP